VRDLAASDFAKRRQLHVQPMAYHLEELREITTRLPVNGRFLDIGTGMGVVPETLLRLGYQVTTVDVAFNEKQKEPLQRLIDLGAEGHFAVVGQEPIPVGDSTQDVVFAGDVIEHLPATPKYFLAELRRVLRPGGYLVISTPNAIRLTVRLRCFVGYSNWPPVAQYIDNPPQQPAHLGHHHEYTGAELCWVLERCGFEVPELRYFEETLRQKGIIRGLADIKTQDRRFDEYWRRRMKWSPYELARRAMIVLVGIFPEMRSVLLASARKPA